MDCQEIDAIIPLWLALIRETAPTNEPDTEAFRLVTTAPQYQAIVEKDKGFIDFYDIYSPGLGNRMIIIQHLYVRPPHRHVGIGKKLVQEVLNRYPGEYITVASEMGAMTFWLKQGFNSTHIQMKFGR